MGRRIGGRGVTMVAAILVLSHWSVLLANAQESQPAPEKRYRTHIVLAGDSTVTDDAGWGKAFAACLVDGAKCTNLSRGGRSSSSFREEGLWQQALDLKPDWVLIQFGHNDEPGHPGRENEPDKGYRANIEKYVDEARAAGIQPVLVTPISRRQWDKKRSDVERIDSSLARYAKVVKEIAAEKEVPLVDLHDHSIAIYESLGKAGCEIISPKKEGDQWDGTHFNAVGGNLFGSVVAMDCRSYIPGLSGYFPTSKLMALQQANRPAPSDRRLGPEERNAPKELTVQGAKTIVVAEDGSGDFTTIQAAIAAAPAANSDRTTINIRPGNYTGQIIVPANKPNLTFAGNDAKTTFITYALTVHDPIPPSVPAGINGYGMVVYADGFAAHDLTFRQLAGDHGQAISVLVEGNNATFDNCQLLGWQDTLRIEGEKNYFRNCAIEGRVDYIYGGGSAVFENCTIHTKKEGYVTAASTPAEQDWGFVFVDCKLTGTGRHTTFLGRPWRPNASVTFINCEMDECIKPAGWDNWRNPENEKTARYAEYHSTGAGGKPEGRVEWSHQLTDEEAARFSPQVLLGRSAGE
jgi:pectinesterase